MTPQLLQTDESHEMSQVDPGYNYEAIIHRLRLHIDSLDQFIVAMTEENHESVQVIRQLEE